MHRNSKVMILILSLSLSGCSLFEHTILADPVDYSILKDDKITLATMTDDRRSIIIVPSALNGKYADLRVCPESPADATDNLAKNINANMTASLKTQLDETSVAPSYAENTSSTLSSIFTRTQGIAFLRDSGNILCLAWLNDIYNQGQEEEWREDFHLILKISAQLIRDEINQKRDK